MKKMLPALIAAAIVLAFAGALFWRMNDGEKTIRPDGFEGVGGMEGLVDQHPLVMWSVTSSANEDPKGYSHSLVTKQTTGPVEGFEGPGVVRFNQSMNLCDQAYAIAKLTFDCTIDEQSVLTMRVADETENGREVGLFVVDPRTLGIAPGAVEGYLVPVAVSDDKKTIYLGRRVETESYVAGLWRIDVPSGAIAEISSVRDKNIFQYDINPVAKQLVGASFLPPERLGESPGLPSSVFLIDLTDGRTTKLSSSHDGTTHAFANENPMLSDDALLFSFHSDDEFGTRVYTVATPRMVANFLGVAKDWFGDTMVVDRDGNLYLYDLATNVETQLTHETDATVEYLGVIK